MSQIEPEGLRVVQTFDVGNGPSALAVGDGAVWVVNTFDGAVSKVDLSSGGVETIPVGPSPAGIAFGAGTVWLTSEATGTLIPLDPRSGEALQPINVGNGPTAVAVGEGSVWVANRQDGTVSRIDPSTSSVSDTIPEVGESPTAVAAGGGAIWVASSEGTIARIDPNLGRIDETIAVESSPSALALADGKVWATTLPAPGSHRGGVLRVEAEFSCECIDPALAGYGWFEASAFTLAYDGLVAYRRVDGIAGAALVPNLALGLPRPTDGGRTYRFQLRPGIRYSNGAALRAEDFRSSLERLSTVNPSYSGLYEGIVGAPACSGPRTELCDLSDGIEIDDAARTITIHLAEPDPDFLHKLALPFASVLPAGTPTSPARTRPVPGTGPYRILPRRSADEIRFVRNTYFDAWSQDARPDGYPDEIRVRVSGPERFRARLAAVERGRADFASPNDHLAELGPSGLRALLTRHAGRLHINPSANTFFMFLNTRVPPFDDIRVRRALNFAFDRHEFAELPAHPPFVEAPCQILPAGFPAHRPYCPYTRDPNEAGTWSAPDLARARVLIAESGTQGMAVKLVTFNLPGGLAIARYFASLLEELATEARSRFAPHSPPTTWTTSPIPETAPRLASKAGMPTSSALQRSCRATSAVLHSFPAAR